MAQKRSSGSKGVKSRAKSVASRLKAKTGQRKSKGTAKKPAARKRKLKVSVTKKQAEQMAVLQLRVGRASHQYSMIAAFALAASGVLLLLTPAGRALEGIPEDAKLLLPWLFPVFAGTLIAALALHLKWKPYSGERGSPHFLMTVIAFLTSLIILLLLVNQSLRGVNPSRLTWLYPSALLGMSLTLISLSMTWRGLGRRKLAGLFSAAFPTALMVYGFTPIFSTGIPPDLLILTFMGSAVAILFSGSMLHIIASSTSLHRPEMIRVSKDRLQLVKEQVESRSEALDYKEKALRSKETDLDVQEEAVTAKIAALDENRRQLEGLHTSQDKRLNELKKIEKDVRSREADLAVSEETMTLREQDVASKEAGFNRTATDLENREEELVKREKVVKTALIDVREREKEAARKSRDVKRLEKEQAGVAKDLEKRKKEVLNVESHLALRERAVAMKEEGAGIKGRGRAVGARLAKLEARLLEREKQLGKREVDVKVAEDKVEATQKKTRQAVQRAKKRLEDIQDKEKSLTTREKGLAEGETNLESRWKDLQRQLGLLEDSVEKVKKKETQYNELYKSAHSKASSVAEAKKDLKGRLGAVQEREAHLNVLSRKLEREGEDLTARRQEVVKMKKDLDAREADLKLKLMGREKEFKKSLRRRPDVDILAEKEKALHMWEKRLRKKEQEMKALLYQKDKELKDRERARQEDVQAEIQEEVEGLVEEEDRVKSGTPRLDDLLLGGVPAESQVLFVGQAFVGKEIGILNFVAEGLKSGVPCILITTSRPPSEISKVMGPILPSFREYEQLGLVKWIDGSTPMPDGNRKAPTVEGNTYVVQSAGDYEGILKALTMAERELGKEDYPYLRLAYMTLSTSLTQGNEKEAMKFVQRLVNRMRKTSSVAIYAIERGMHSDQQIKAVEHQMDGAIHFRVDGQKNQLAVAGICDVQTRDWVDYKYTNRALMIGSFMLERIR